MSIQTESKELIQLRAEQARITIQAIHERLLSLSQFTAIPTVKGLEIINNDFIDQINKDLEAVYLKMKFIPVMGPGQFIPFPYPNTFSNGMQGMSKPFLQAPFASPKDGS